jgi:transcriptional regulator with XRE-family HTH domain
MTLVELRRLLRAHQGPLRELASRAGTTAPTVSRIAKGKRGCSPSLRTRLAAAAGPPEPRRPDRRLRDNPEALEEAWKSVEERSPTWGETQAALREAQHAAYRFAQLPPDQRTPEAWAPVEEAWQAWERVESPASVYSVTRKAVEDAWEHGKRERGATSSEVTEMAKAPQRRVKRRQHAGLVPHVVYREEDDEPYTPTPQEARFRDLLHAARAARDDPETARVWEKQREETRRRRWQRTLQLSAEQASEWAEHRKRAEQLNGPLRIVTAKPPRRRRKHHPSPMTPGYAHPRTPSLNAHRGGRRDSGLPLPPRQLISVSTGMTRRS